MPATTLDPTNKAAGITLSGANLVATAASGTNPGVNATRRLTGDTYVEVTATTLSSNVAIGLATLGWNESNAVLLGNDASGLSYNQSGQVRSNNAILATYDPFVQGNLVRLAISPRRRRLWVAVGAGNWNASPTANPETESEGLDISGFSWNALLIAISMSVVAPNQVCTCVFTSGFAYTPPTGFVSPDTCQSASDQLIAALRSLRQATPPDNTQYTVFRIQGFGGMPAGDQTRIPRFYTGDEKAIQGEVRQIGIPVARTVRIYERTSGLLLGETVSDAVTGFYSIDALGVSGEVVDVALGELPYDALILDRVPTDNPISKAHNLVVARFVDTPAFFSATATGGSYMVLPGLYNDAALDSFPAPTVGRGSVSVTSAYLDDRSDTIPSPTVAVGATTLTAARYDESTDSFPTTTVALGNVQSLTAPLVSDLPDSFPSPTIRLSVTAAYLDDRSDSFPAATVILASPQTLTQSSSFSDTPDSFPAPTISGGGMTLAPGFLSHTNTFYAPTAATTNPGSGLVFNFTDDTYVAPAGDAIVFDF